MSINRLRRLSSFLDNLVRRVLRRPTLPAPDVPLAARKVAQAVLLMESDDMATTQGINRALLMGLSVIGVRAGEYVRQNPDAGPRIQNAIEALAAGGHLTPRIHAELPLADAARALRMLGDRSVVGKLVLMP